jgi:hypothetical protein
MQEGEANSRAAELQETLARLRSMGIANRSLRKAFEQMQETETLKKQGPYVALRAAAFKSLEILETSLTDGVADLEQAIKDSKVEIEDTHLQIKGEVQAAESRIANVRQEQEQDPGRRGITYIIVGVFCVAPGTVQILIGSSLNFFSIAGILIGGLVIIAGLGHFRRGSQL